jgi:hypothetical protein
MKIFQTRVFFFPYGVGFSKENDTRDNAKSQIQKWRDSFGFRGNHAINSALSVTRQNTHAEPRHKG